MANEDTLTKAPAEESGGVEQTRGRYYRPNVDILENDDELYEEIVMELIERGAMPDSDGREPWILCYTLSEQDVADTLTAFEGAVKAAKG